MAKITHRYDLPDYAAFMNIGFDLRLPDEVLKSVSELADLVGAPTYIKTPVFPVREHGDFRNAPTPLTSGGGYHIAGSSANSFQSRFGNDIGGIGNGTGTGAGVTSGTGTGGTGISRSSMRHHGHGHGHGHGNGPQQIPNSEWETILSFQKTELKKKEGIELSIDNIRSYLNKLTDKTYDTMFANIMKEISSLMSAASSGVGLDDEEHNAEALMNRVASSIFTTASSNAFYSEIYARLFRDLMAQGGDGGIGTVFREVFERNLTSFMSLFETIEYCDPKKNYDKFCDINKANEKRKAMSLFIVNLMKIEIVEKSQVVALMRQIQELLYANMRQEGKTNEVDELAENLFIMVKHGHAVLSAYVSTTTADTDLADAFRARIEQITEVSKMKLKSKPSITNKTIFKHLDMLDEISGKAKK